MLNEPVSASFYAVSIHAGMQTSAWYFLYSDPHKSSCTPALCLHEV